METKAAAPRSGRHRRLSILLSSKRMLANIGRALRLSRLGTGSETAGAFLLKSNFENLPCGKTIDNSR